MLTGIESVFRAARLDLMLYHVGEADNRESFFHDLPARRKVDAVLVVGIPVTEAEQQRLALMGVEIGFVHTATFAIGSGLAAAAGALLGPVFVVYPTMGDLASLKAFAIVILGGLGSIPGATIGGFILAFMEELGAGYVSSGFRDGMGFLIIILILLVKPTGLFAQKERIG